MQILACFPGSLRLKDEAGLCTMAALSSSREDYRTVFHGHFCQANFRHKELPVFLRSTFLTELSKQRRTRLMTPPDSRLSKKRVAPRRSAAATLGMGILRFLNTEVPGTPDAPDLGRGRVESMVPVPSRNRHTKPQIAFASVLTHVLIPS